MTVIRHITIQNFRCIHQLQWQPSPGINCLIGPGDSGKSTILDAIDLCVGARRSINMNDADFYKLDETAPIVIQVTLGDLEDALKNFEIYGEYLRGFNPENGTIVDEPQRGLDTVLTVQLLVGDDLEPQWSLISNRAEVRGMSRNLTWGDRIQIAPTRIGVFTEYNLAWKKGSILTKLADEKPDASGALASAARNARTAFGEEAEEQLGDTLKIVTETAKELGIPIGENAKAMLDTHSISFTGGTISLHDDEGVPLKGLGIGSSRLLIAGLQQKAAKSSSMILIDELEYGLEPHRIVRLLHSLGAKDESSLQVFATTHSPIVLRELSGNQLFVLRSNDGTHDIRCVGTNDLMQGTIRSFPEAFLAKSTIICEGASEVGLIRGIDQYRVSQGGLSIGALGVALVDCGGGSPDKFYERAEAFSQLGYRVSVFRDDDKKPTPAVEEHFVLAGGEVFHWQDDRALEDELFASVSDKAFGGMLEYAVEVYGEDVIDAQLRSVSGNDTNLNGIRNALAIGDGGLSQEDSDWVGKTAKNKTNSWFKSVSKMEVVGRDIVAPDLGNAMDTLTDVIDRIFVWCNRDA